MIDEYKATIKVNLSSKEKLNNLNKLNIIVVHLNISYLKSTFDNLLGQITGNLDILKVSETKLNESRPVGQFIIDSFEVRYSEERDANGLGIMLLEKEDILSKFVSLENSRAKAFWRDRSYMVTLLLL